MARGQRGDGDDAVRLAVDELLGNHRGSDPPVPEEVARGCLEVVLGMVVLGIESAVAAAVWRRLDGHGPTQFGLAAAAWLATGLVLVPLVLTQDALLKRIRRLFSPR